MTTTETTIENLDVYESHQWTSKDWEIKVTRQQSHYLVQAQSTNTHKRRTLALSLHLVLKLAYQFPAKAHNQLASI